MINRVIINGNLGRNPEVRKTQSGKSVCYFSICQSRTDKNGNQIVKWFYLNAWEHTADFLGQYCRKGDMILVDGHVDYREYENDGKRKTVNEMIADTITLERRGQNHAESAQPSTYGQPVQYEQTNPQPTQPQSFPAYTQPSMMPGNTVPAQANNYDLPEWSKGIDIGSDDLPF